MFLKEANYKMLKIREFWLKTVQPLVTFIYVCLQWENIDHCMVSESILFQNHQSCSYHFFFWWLWQFWSCSLKIWKNLKRVTESEGESIALPKSSARIWIGSLVARMYIKVLMRCWCHKQQLCPPSCNTNPDLISSYSWFSMSSFYVLVGELCAFIKHTYSLLTSYRCTQSCWGYYHNFMYWCH